MTSRVESTPPRRLVIVAGCDDEVDCEGCGEGDADFGELDAHAAMPTVRRTSAILFMVS
jgi:hypothetical protein